MMGTFKIELFADKAPKTVQHFIDLVKRGFYKDMFFHKVVAGFVIQTGDPTGTGRGGLGNGVPLEIHPSLKHDRPGIVGMARSADLESGTSAMSQFYITLAPITVPQLDGKYTIFGQVIEGLDVVLAIGQVEVDSDNRPIISVILHSITIQE
jgi:cyclophilin family peptidyl-prolyl cis-trans isomerase